MKYLNMSRTVNEWVHFIPVEVIPEIGVYTPRTPLFPELFRSFETRPNEIVDRENEFE